MAANGWTSPALHYWNLARFQPAGPIRPANLVAADRSERVTSPAMTQSQLLSSCSLGSHHEPNQTSCAPPVVLADVLEPRSRERSQHGRVVSSSRSENGRSICVLKSSRDEAMRQLLATHFRREEHVAKLKWVIFPAEIHACLGCDPLAIARLRSLQGRNRFEFSLDSPHDERLGRFDVRCKRRGRHFATRHNEPVEDGYLTCGEFIWLRSSNFNFNGHRR